jgi:hypothetical protein
MRRTKTEGVISGNLSDRFLGDHGNILVRAIHLQHSCRCQKLSAARISCLAGIAKSHDLSVLKLDKQEEYMTA